ncbi:DNA cytosine methyltransferase [Pusillimonas sp. ANT_WB101]|uniref:DNA cytosine methyltransferase n=1 Tax=Pusillimonas sp. ANT_WB101 TaxID=2597356 RepID=UPI0011EEDF72|nr:DNA cytosine methyltransferase [Pusillimonas sp. ANT_WB101]KAA0910456.1 hypothetical protein FQ179_00720 [Pusillimonas sp. ANT_WB101]
MDPYPSPQGSPSRTDSLPVFPTGYNFSGSQCSIFKQIGNAVPCRFAYAIARAVRGFGQDKVDMFEADFHEGNLSLELIKVLGLISVNALHGYLKLQREHEAVGMNIEGSVIAGRSI